MKNIIISNPKKLEKIRNNFIKDGVKKLHILSDFDRTLTTASVKGKLASSLITSLSDKYLSKTYRKKYRQLYNQYFPIEINQNIKLEEKKKAMAEWWNKIFDLLIKEGLNKRDLEKFIISQNIKLRDGFDKFISLLKKQNIPLIILSSTGLGKEAISMYLKKENGLSKNIHIISNNFKWDKKGYAIAVKKPIIHAANKDETILKNFSVFPLIKKRKNVILLGDNIEDTSMIKGFAYNNLIRIGFLNDRQKKDIKIYKLYYDIIILNDGGLEYINELLKEIIKEK